MSTKAPYTLRLSADAAAPPEPSWAVERERNVAASAWAAARRRKWLILSVTLLVFTGGFAGLLALPPAYRASGTVLLEAPKTVVFQRPGVTASTPPATEMLADELEVLRSRELLRRVVARLGLEADPDFNPLLRPSRLLAAADSLIGLLGRWSEEPVHRLLALLGVQRAEAGGLDATVQSLDRNVTVGPIGRSRAIEITATARVPERAAAIANGVAEAYLEMRAELRAAELRSISAWMNSELAALRARIDTSARAVVEFRATNGVVNGLSRTDLSANLVQQEISEVASQITALRLRRSELAARLRDAEAAMAARNMDGLASVLDSRTIQQFRVQEAQSAARLADLASQYGRSHPALQAVNAELADIRRNIAREADRILQSTRNEAGVAETHYRALTERLRALRGEVAQADGVEVRLQELQRDVSADRLVAENFLVRARELGAEARLRDTGARVVSEATVPRLPYAPNLQLLLPLLAFVSLGAGGVAALAREAMARGMRSVEDLGDAGVVPLGVIPLWRRRWDRLGQAMFREAIAGLCAHLVRPRPGGVAPRSLLVTSANPGEGKSTVARALAAEAAGRGMRVILVDADLRGQRRRGPAEAGLSDVLRADTTLHAALRPVPDGDYRWLPPGPRPPNPTQLLASGAMERLLRQMEAEAELVIIDAPPVPIGGDVPALARMASQSVLLVRWEHTRADEAAAALRSLRIAGAALAGVTMSMVDTRYNEQYRHGDASFFSRRMRRYYLARG
ncbi:GumC family protein [Teichococcus aestuarii]|nr:polysaccharide biosynthesis tyrosine autokinase [Pseudoroseomonas aestuarii]